MGEGVNDHHSPRSMKGIGVNAAPRGASIHTLDVTFIAVITVTLAVANHTRIGRINEGKNEAGQTNGVGELGGGLAVDPAACCGRGTEAAGREATGDRSTVDRALASERPPKYERPAQPTTFTPLEGDEGPRVLRRPAVRVPARQVS
jgi:hypothetical protein